jgi:predicted kinase
MPGQGRPTLIVVSGPPGSGKTTLAHALAAAIPCPAICRDEIREGLVHAHPDRSAEHDRELMLRTNKVFFAAVKLFIEAGVTAVIEAAFQHRLWHPGLQPLIGLADLRVVRCSVEEDVARERIRCRVSEVTGRTAHHDTEFLAALEAGRVSIGAWEPPRLDVPTFVVDTNAGYRPELEEIVAFARRERD